MNNGDRAVLKYPYLFVLIMASIELKHANSPTKLFLKFSPYSFQQLKGEIYLVFF